MSAKGIRYILKLNARLDPSEVDLAYFETVSVRSFDDDGDLLLESCGDLME